MPPEKEKETEHLISVYLSIYFTFYFIFINSSHHLHVPKVGCTWRSHQKMYAWRPLGPRRTARTHSAPMPIPEFTQCPALSGREPLASRKSRNILILILRLRFFFVFVAGSGEPENGDRSFLCFGCWSLPRSGNFFWIFLVVFFGVWSLGAVLGKKKLICPMPCAQCSVLSAQCCVEVGGW